MLVPRTESGVWMDIYAATLTPGTPPRSVSSADFHDTQRRLQLDVGSAMFDSCLVYQLDCILAIVSNDQRPS